jgi:glycosyltransferase involved in cell wall biosynthesis
MFAMPRIALLTPSITTGDAVSNDVLGMYDVLLERGHEVRIYADGCGISQPKVWSTSKINRFIADGDGLLIYHYAIGWDRGLEILRELRCKTVIKYHNVTPPEYFTRFSEAHVLMSHGGRKQLQDIAKARVDLFLSDSEYNRRELLAEGAEESISSVIPPFHHIDRLNSVEPDTRVLKTYREGATNVLMVGRVAPHKKHPDLIEAFAHYHFHYNSNSRLLIVGKEDGAFQSYYKLLHEIVNRLKLENAVVFTGGVTNEALKAYYMVADVFLITSQHEGFCVPLVEAMAMKLPIVAYSSSAIPGTVGPTALVWPERNPNLVAESIDMIVNDEHISAGLGQMGWQRYQQVFSNEKIKQLFIDTLSRVL